jgi:hypothetical protein
MDESPTIVPSVLDMLQKSVDRSLWTVLRNDVLARDRFLSFGVPLGADSDRLRFRNWKVRYKQQNANWASVRWSESGHLLCLLSLGHAHVVSGAHPEQQGMTVALPHGMAGSRARWLNADSELLICCGSSRRLVCVNVETTVMQSYDCGTLTALQDCVGHGPLVFAGARDGAVYVWDTREGSDRVRRVPAGRNGAVGCLDVSSDGQLLATSTTMVDLWDTRKLNKPVVSYSQHQLGLAGPASTAMGTQLSLSALEFEPGTNTRLAVQAANGCCNLFDLTSLSHSSVLSSVDDARPSEAGVSFLPNAPWLAVASGPRIRLCSTNRRKKRGCSLELASTPLAVSCSQLGGLAITTRNLFILFGDEN